jgi:tRNA-dihydrouridine synthase A
MRMSIEGAPRFPAGLSVAPMMDWTDRHCRYFHRLLAPSAVLYTEMVHSAAIVRSDHARLLDNREVHGPVVLQIGGCDPQEMAEAAAIGAGYGFAQININVGCPSDRVQSGRFGACLMAQPERVAACVQAMRERVDVPVTVKTRIGIDDHDSDAFFARFVDTVAAAGCDTFVVHARIAVLAGLSPKQNREVPPLNYARVHRLKSRRPELTVVLNGGLTQTDQVSAHAGRVDGVMIGRAAYHNPWLLTQLERLHNPAYVAPEREAVLMEMANYAERQVAQGIPLRAIARHTLGLFQGLPGARAFRRTLSESMPEPGASPDLLRRALAPRVRMRRRAQAPPSSQTR